MALVLFNFLCHLRTLVTGKMNANYEDERRLNVVHAEAQWPFKHVQDKVLHLSL